LRPASENKPLSFSEPERLYGIAELAGEFGVTPRAIRFYEAKGLLSPRRVNGSRVYTKRERVRLMLLLRAKSIGFSLAEIKHVLDLYGEHGEGKPKQVAFVAEKIGEIIKELEQKQANLTATLEELREIHRQCVRFLSEGGICKKGGSRARSGHVSDLR